MDILQYQLWVLINQWQSAKPGADSQNLADRIDALLDAIAEEAPRSWNPMSTAPRDGTLILVVMEDNEVLTVRSCGDQDEEHNDWWTTDGLDLSYGCNSPLGWLSRDALPPKESICG